QFIGRHAGFFARSGKGLGDLCLDRTVLGARFHPAKLCHRARRRNAGQGMEAGVANLWGARADVGDLLKANDGRIANRRDKPVVWYQARTPDQATEQVAVLWVDGSDIVLLWLAVDDRPKCSSGLANLSEHLDYETGKGIVSKFRDQRFRTL